MGRRFHIRVGDMTTRGGRVATGLSTVTWHGHALAFEGDQVECPACGTTGHIVAVGTRISSTGPHGKQQALSGDLCLCRCTPPPQLVASQQTSWVEGDMAEGGAMHPTISADAWHVGMPPQAVTKEGHAPDSCDQRFLLRDEADGTPLAHRLYRLRHPGGMLQGRTDAQGHTERVTGTGGSQIRIEIFGEDA